MQDSSVIKSTMVSLEVGKRQIALDQHYGQRSVEISKRIVSLLAERCPQHKGALWDMYELSNGGFFIAPKRIARPVTAAHGSAEVSAEAAGVVANLIGYREFERESSGFTDLRKALEVYAAQHPEAEQIRALTA